MKKIVPVALAALILIGAGCGTPSKPNAKPGANQGYPGTGPYMPPVAPPPKGLPVGPG